MISPPAITAILSFATNVPARERETTYSISLFSPFPPVTGMETFSGLMEEFSCRRRRVTVLSEFMLGVIRSILPTSFRSISTVGSVFSITPCVDVVSPTVQPVTIGYSLPSKMRETSLFAVRRVGVASVLTFPSFCISSIFVTRSELNVLNEKVGENESIAADAVWARSAKRLSSFDPLTAPDLPLKKYWNDAVKSSVISSSRTFTSMSTIGVGTSRRFTRERISSIILTSLVLTISILFLREIETNILAGPNRLPAFARSKRFVFPASSAPSIVFAAAAESENCPVRGNLRLDSSLSHCESRESASPLLNENIPAPEREPDDEERGDCISMNCELPFSSITRKRRKRRERSYSSSSSNSFSPSESNVLSG